MPIYVERLKLKLIVWFGDSLVWREMNKGSWLPEEEEEEELKGLSDDFFDDLMNHIEEDMETAASDDDEEEEGDWDAKFENLVPPPLDVLTSFSSQFTTSHGRASKGVQRKKPVPTLVSFIFSMPSCLFLIVFPFCIQTSIAFLIRYV